MERSGKNQKSIKMKHVLLITVFGLTMATQSMAQSQNAIKINHLQNESSKENHRFEIQANEDLDVNLKFSLKKEGNINIVVTDHSDRVVLTKKFRKKGDNRLSFSMSQDEKYIVKLSAEEQSNMVVLVPED